MCDLVFAWEEFKFLDWKAMFTEEENKEFMAKKVKETYEKDARDSREEGSAGSEEAVAEDTVESAENRLDGSEFEDLNSLITELERATSALDEEKAKTAEMQSRYLRAIADLENYRKRAIKEKEELAKTVIGNFVEDLLPVLDNFKLGMKAADAHPEAKVVSDGFQMVLNQFMDTFKEKGIEEIIPNGKEFDPQWEECVSHLPNNDVPENHVIDTIRAGYKIKDKLIRAATVVVSSGPAQS